MRYIVRKKVTNVTKFTHFQLFYVRILLYRIYFSLFIDKTLSFRMLF